MSCNQPRVGAACNTEVDYSQVPGDRVLPFVMTLNMTDSILNPSAGQNQRFCYDLVGVGTDTSTYADLSHFVLNICDQIPAEQITNITVTIDGVPQEVTFGDDGNVQLRTAARPDPPTGCVGLKFDFPLKKDGGEMQVCFELTVPRAVGPNGVCMFGGGVTVNSLAICGPSCAANVQCPVVGYQSASVCVPITVTPFAKVGVPVTTCCGDPVILPGDVCPRTTGVCRFTIRQQVCVAVPVEFGANAVAGTPSVQCTGTSKDDICTGCTTPPAKTSWD